MTTCKQKRCQVLWEDVNGGDVSYVRWKVVPSSGYSEGEHTVTECWESRPKSGGLACTACTAHAVWWAASDDPLATMWHDSNLMNWKWASQQRWALTADAEDRAPEDARTHHRYSSRQVAKKQQQQHCILDCAITLE